MAIQLNYLEKDIEDLIQSDCGHYLSCRFIARQVKTPVGVIDVIARSWVKKGLFYVFELKNGPLDADAYLQVVRYTKWLNSERSRYGKRLFVPVLIGNTLREDLHRVVEYFEPIHSGWYDLFGRVFYRVFNFDPKRGVSFEWVNHAQRGHHKSLAYRYHHPQTLSERYDQLHSYYERISLESRRRDIGAYEPSLTLVKDGDAA